MAEVQFCYIFTYHVMAELYNSEEKGNMIGVCNGDGQKCSYTFA